MPPTLEGLLLRPGAYKRRVERGKPFAAVVPHTFMVSHALRLLSAVCLCQQAGGGFCLGVLPLDNDSISRSHGLCNW